jgi:hypothetical protein
MGAQAWSYIVPYQTDVKKALQTLRQRELQAGRYYPIVESLEFPVTENTPSFQPLHTSIEAALESVGESGTGSILDIFDISDETGSSLASPLLPEESLEYLGTVYPTRQIFEDEVGIGNLLSLIGRGEAIYCFLYENEEPQEILFIGYSFD